MNQPEFLVDWGRKATGQNDKVGFKWLFSKRTSLFLQRQPPPPSDSTTPPLSPCPFSSVTDRLCRVTVARARLPFIANFRCIVDVPARRPGTQNRFFLPHYTPARGECLTRGKPGKRRARAGQTEACMFPPQKHVGAFLTRGAVIGWSARIESIRRGCSLHLFETFRLIE